MFLSMCTHSDTESIANENASCHRLAKTIPADIVTVFIIERGCYNLWPKEEKFTLASIQKYISE